MKKNFFIILSFFVFTLGGCTNSDNKITEINLEEGDKVFDNQVDGFQYIKDLENYLSYDILSLTEDKPYNSDFSFSVKFDKNSTLQGGVNFSKKKISKSHDLEASDIEIVVKAESSEKDEEPFDLSGSVSLLYKDNELYANLHSLDVFMGEGNMVAKMYTLLGDMIVDKWVNLEVHSGGVVEVDESDNKRLPYIVGTLKNVLKSEWINEDSPKFLNGIAELLDTVNSHIDLGISTNELKMINHEISYFELGDKSIQKKFTGSFEGRDSAFDLSFIVSKKGLEVSLYNVKEYNQETSKYEDMEKDFKFSINENKKSEYLVEFEFSKLQQKVVELKGEITYADSIKFFADFILEPLELIEGQKLSGKIEGVITKKSGESDKEFPEISGEILSVTELLSSL